ncbi:DUF4185 domain-containing protein [Virgibacillus oceani]|uniref:DUF4185 domain-containing protein n=1 Tax=Virgibacillus oceani TaxID=1479511 RepID=A0A917M2C2_9BACI|nr:DUF4185 domain-containing protein [Virgibacillus oceani]GGG72743.1 hypothetical protein GCM10011398_16380 [Virgibacillus oceani]
MKKKPLIVAASTLLLAGSIATPSMAETKQESFELIATKAKKVARVTGATLEGEDIPNPNQTHTNYGLTATDLGIVWDATTDPDDKKVMIAFGDSYDDGWGGSGGGGDPEGWRGNLLAISKDTDLSDGLSFSSMITKEDDPNYAKEIIHSEHDTSGDGDFTAIPTAGITVGDRHFIHYMQIKNWGANGRWNTNFSEIAYSDDEGQNWTKSDVKWDADSKFAQAAYVKKDGYVYMFGTPAGRFDNAYLARVAEEDMLKKASYEYWDGSGWVENDEEAAAPVIDVPVSELSVQYNSYYDKWIMMYLNENRYAMVMRSSSSLTEGWSAETVVATGEEYPSLYGGFIHPWTNDGKDLYFLMSEWGPYNVVLMKAELDIGKPKPNLVADPSFEDQDSETIEDPWVLEDGEGGVDAALGNSRGGSNNVFLRNTSGWNGITQSVQVEKNTVYELTGFVKTSQNNNAGYFGVRGENGDIIKETKFERNDNYTKQTIRFNSGDNESVTVFTGMWANGDTWVQIDDYLLVEVDPTPPVITLNGEETIEVPLGASFEDPGATADDNLDGDLTDKIQVSGEVNTAIKDTYTLTYTVTDADGNKAEPVTRTVKVTGEDYTLSDTEFTDKNGNPITKLPKDGLVMGTAAIKNNTSNDKTVALAVVLYDKKDNVVNVSGVTKAIKPGVTETFTGGFMMPGNNSGYYAEVFLAKSLTDLEPISDVERIEQK